MHLASPSVACLPWSSEIVFKSLSSSFRLLSLYFLFVFAFSPKSAFPTIGITRYSPEALGLCSERLRALAEYESTEWSGVRVPANYVPFYEAMAKAVASFDSPQLSLSDNFPIQRKLSLLHNPEILNALIARVKEESGQKVEIVRTEIDGLEYPHGISFTVRRGSEEWHVYLGITKDRFQEDWAMQALSPYRLDHSLPIVAGKPALGGYCCRLDNLFLDVGKEPSAEMLAAIAEKLAPTKPEEKKILARLHKKIKETNGDLIPVQNILHPFPQKHTNVLTIPSWWNFHNRRTALVGEWCGPNCFNAAKNWRRTSNWTGPAFTSLEEMKKELNRYYSRLPPGTQLRTGDLVIIKDSKTGNLDHAAVYVGGNYVWHKESMLANGFYTFATLSGVIRSRSHYSPPAPKIEIYRTEK